MARSKYEKRAHKELVTEGYLVDYKIRPSRPNPYYNTDYFNLFDLIAYRPGELRFISIKGRQGLPGPHKRDLEAFQLPLGCIKEAWYPSHAKGKFKWIKKILNSESHSERPDQEF